MKNIRIKFTKKDQMVYISHLDLMRLFQRAFRRSGIMLKHSEGFNPQPKMSFATALALGSSSDGEYMDVELESDMDLDLFTEKINESLPSGIKVVKASEKKNKDSIMSLIEWGQYLVQVNSLEAYSEEKVNESIKEFLSYSEIIEIKQKKKKNKITTKETNIRPNIKTLELVKLENDELILKMFLKTGSNGNLKPEIVLEKLNELTELQLDLESVKVHRIDLFIEEDTKIVTPI